MVGRDEEDFLQRHPLRASFFGGEIDPHSGHFPPRPSRSPEMNPCAIVPCRYPRFHPLPKAFFSPIKGELCFQAHPIFSCVFEFLCYSVSNSRPWCFPPPVSPFPGRFLFSIFRSVLPCSSYFFEVSPCYLISYFASPHQYGDFADRFGVSALSPCLISSVEPAPALKCPLVFFFKKPLGSSGNLGLFPLCCPPAPQAFFSSVRVDAFPRPPTKFRFESCEAVLESRPPPSIFLRSPPLKLFFCRHGFLPQRTPAA